MLMVVVSEVEVDETKVEYVKYVDSKMAEESAGKKMHGKFWDVADVTD